MVRLSIIANNLTGGPKDYTLCARFYEGRLLGQPVHTFLVKVTDRIFWFDEQHCRKAWLQRF